MGRGREFEGEGEVVSQTCRSTLQVLIMLLNTIIKFNVFSTPKLTLLHCTRRAKHARGSIKIEVHD